MKNTRNAQNINLFQLIDTIFEVGNIRVIWSGTACALKPAMKSAKEVKHLLISLYGRTFGGGLDELEVWLGTDNDYLLMRKADGWTVTIPRVHLDDYLSNDKPTREQGRASLIDAFHRFKEPSEE